MPRYPHSVFVYPEENFGGTPKRFNGPDVFEDLRNNGWDNKIKSFEVGTEVGVAMYRDFTLEGAKMLAGPGSSIPAIGGDLRNQISSMEIYRPDIINLKTKKKRQPTKAKSRRKSK